MNMEIKMTDTVTHLKQLEAEGIHILREVAAEFDNPVMLFTGRTRYTCVNGENMKVLKKW
jgi:3'-phosphoadenosine 5'-phosphosulfate sulfotransferase (PAPS reductase)/FAD synthetase